MAARLVPPSRLANLGLAHCRGASIRVASEDDKKKRHRPLFARLASQQVAADPMYLANSFDGAASGMQAPAQPQQLLPSLQTSVVANDTTNTAALTGCPATPALEPPAVSANAMATTTTSVNPSHLEHRLDSLALPPLALQDLFSPPRYALTSTATSAMAAPVTSGMLATVPTPVAYALPAELTQQPNPSNTNNGGGTLLPSLDAPVSNNFSNFGFEDLRLLLDEGMFADPAAAVPCDVLSATPPTTVVTPGTSSGSSSNGDAAMLAAAAFDGTLDGLLGSSLDVPSMAMPPAAAAASPDSNANDPMASLLDAVVADTGAGPMDISADVLSEASIDDFADESLDVRSLQQHSPRNLSDGSSSEGDDAGNLFFSVGVAAAMTDVQTPHGARRTRSGRLSQQRHRAGERPMRPVEGPVAASSRTPSAPKRVTSNSSAKTRRRKNVRSLQTPVRSSGPRKRRTQRSRKEPERVMFATDEEFNAAWQRWRQSRDSNNESVHRSRELLRKQRAETAQLKANRERDVRRLEAEASSLQQTLSLLVKATQDPHSLQPDEVQRLRETMKPPVAQSEQPEPQASVPPSHAATANRLCNTAL